MDNLLKHAMRSLLMIFVLIMPATTCSGEVSDALMDESKTIKGIYVYKSTLKPRSAFSSSTEKFSRDGKVFYKITEQGRGDYDKYENVTWKSDAEVEEKESLLYVIYSLQIIRDKDENILVKHEKRFDYDKKKICYTASDGEGKILMKRRFPIKGKTTDNITMMHFLERFVAHRNEKAYRNFYLISNEPKFYRINIKVMESEELELPIGRIKAIKLRLIPDMGLLTGLAGLFIPPTFVWYTEEPPYSWLQYEGLETSLGSMHIVASISP
ncbi:MAG: hypothetical protein HQ579_02385 [Candidatus Omnitrophica bacterium]|nr:hypothetical protein [Candidatus Omnitrophota bacterium]